MSRDVCGQPIQIPSFWSWRKSFTSTNIFAGQDGSRLPPRWISPNDKWKFGFKTEGKNLHCVQSLCNSLSFLPLEWNTKDKPLWARMVMRKARRQVRATTTMTVLIWIWMRGKILAPILVVGSIRTRRAIMKVKNHIKPIHHHQSKKLPNEKRNTPIAVVDQIHLARIRAQLQ